MIARLRKLHVCVLILVTILLLYPTSIIFKYSELKTRLFHQCLNLNISLDSCYVSYYQSIGETRGTKEALRELRERNQVDQHLATTCHSSAHAIGRIAFREYGSIAKAYAEGDYSCWGGYMHGVVEGSMREKTPHDVAGETLRTTCSEVKGERVTFAYFSCVHGLGHALMYVWNNDLPRALIACDDLIDEWEILQCTNGAFMENLFAGDTEHQSRFRPNDDPNFPCSIVREKDVGVCYLVQGKFILDYVKWDFKKAFEFCDGLPVDTNRQFCAQGLGAAVSNTAAYDPEKITKMCNMSPESLLDRCLYGAMTDLEGVAGNTSLGSEVCQSQPEEKQSRCLKIRDEAHTLFPGSITEATPKSPLIEKSAP